MAEYCLEDGSIDWEKIVKINSMMKAHSAKGRL